MEGEMNPHVTLPYFGFAAFSNFFAHAPWRLMPFWSKCFSPRSSGVDQYFSFANTSGSVFFSPPTPPGPFHLYLGQWFEPPHVGSLKAICFPSVMLSLDDHVFIPMLIISYWYFLWCELHRHLSISRIESFFARCIVYLLLLLAMPCCHVTYTKC